MSPTSRTGRTSRLWAFDAPLVGTGSAAPRTFCPHAFAPDIRPTTAVPIVPRPAWNPPTANPTSMGWVPVSARPHVARPIRTPHAWHPDITPTIVVPVPLHIHMVSARSHPMPRLPAPLTSRPHPAPLNPSPAGSIVVVVVAHMRSRGRYVHFSANVSDAARIATRDSKRARGQHTQAHICE